MEERGLRRASSSSGTTATRRSRIGHRLLVKMGLRQVGPTPMFDTAHRNYTWLKHYVEETKETLTAYAVQLARMTEAARDVGLDTSHLYQVQDQGYKPVVAFKEAQDKGHIGYAGQLQQAFVKGVIDPVGEWHRDLERIENLVADFNEIRVQHDHYRLKVDDLGPKYQALQARATTRGDAKDAKHAKEKLDRNKLKLKEVEAEYNKRLNSCCDRMTGAYDEREKMMNGIMARIIHFQESFFAEQLLSSLGVSRILSEAEGRGPRWGGTEGIEPFLSRGHVRIMEGELLRKHTLIKERMWYRLVGSSLEVYEFKSKENESLYVVTEAPITVYEVKGVTKMSDVNFRVTVLNGDASGLNLFAADEADAKSWVDALQRASEWDQLQSSRKVEGNVRESRAFLNRCKIAHRNTTTVEGLERELGVTEALANPPPPPPDRPDADNPSRSGGGASAASGGGGGKEAKGAAGIAPGGEAGIAVAGMSAAAVAAGAKWKDKTKKGDDEIPDLVASEKKKGAKKGGGGAGGGGKGGGGPPPGLAGGGRGDARSEIGIGGLFPGGRTGRPSFGMMGGGGSSGPNGVPLGMLGGHGHMNPPNFSSASSSFNGSTHGSISGSQMGDPRLRMAQPQMGMVPPPVNPTTGLPPGMMQNGPPVVLPLGMVPSGGGPVMTPGGPPAVVDPFRGPGVAWGGGPPPAQQPPVGWGGAGAGLPHTRSFGSRFGGPKPGGGRQQGFRRSNSFNDQRMSRGGVFDEMGYAGSRLSPMMEDEDFDTQSTRSAPAFGAAAAVGGAAAAAAAATAAAARVASKKESSGGGGGHEESKSSKKVADAGFSSVPVATAATSSPAPSPPRSPAHVPVTIESRPKKEAAAATVSSSVVVEKTSGQTAGSSSSSSSRTTTTTTTTTTAVKKTSNAAEVKVPAAGAAAAAAAAATAAAAKAPAASAASSSGAVTASSSSANTTAAIRASDASAAVLNALPLEPHLFDRRDDGGLSRYDTAGEAPPRARSKPLPTWKRMMSFGSTSGRSYRYDEGELGLDDEAKPTVDDVIVGSRPKDTSTSPKRSRSDRWPRRQKSSASSSSTATGTGTSPARGALAPASSTRLRAAATTVAESKTTSSSSERRSSSAGRASRLSNRGGRSRGGSASAVASSAAAGARGAKALSPSEDFALDDEEFKRAPPARLSRDETSIGGRTTRVKTFKRPSPTKTKAKETAKATAAATGATSAAAAAAAAAATARETSAAAIRKAGASSASAGASVSSSSAPAVGARVASQVEAPAATVVTVKDASARSTGVAVTPSPIIVASTPAAASGAPAASNKSGAGPALAAAAAAGAAAVGAAAAGTKSSGSSTTTAANTAAEKAEQYAAKYAEERKASAEAAKRVDNSTGIMKNLTLQEIMDRSEAEDQDGGGGRGGGGRGGGGVTIGGTSGGTIAGGKSFDVAVPAATTATGAVAAGVAAIKAKIGGGRTGGASDSATLGTAPAVAGSNGSSPTSAASNRATVGEPTPIVPAKEPGRPEPRGCEAITPAFAAALAAKTTSAAAATPASTAPTLTPRTAAKSAATAAAEASSQAEAAASAASAAAAAAVAASVSPTRSANDGGGGSVSPPLASATADAASVPAPSPDTPGSTGSGAQVAAQAKVFQRLSNSSSSEAETGDAGGGAAGGGPGEESTLSFQQLMGWDEVQELLEYGALKETELTGLWQEAFRAQEVEQGRADPLAKSIDIWGSSSATSTAAAGAGAAAGAVAPAEGSAAGGGGATKEALTQRGFMILVKLIEELQFEKELEQDKGVGLAPGRVCVV